MEASPLKLKTLVTVNKLGIILEKTALGFECEGVLNPGVIKVGNDIHLFYRALAKNNYSTIGYCKMTSPMEIEHRKSSPILFPELDSEIQGIEDPRIVEIEGIFYIIYTAYDGYNALGAIAISTDLVNWEKKGIIVPQIQFEEFKHFVESRNTIEEKYIRYNANQKVHDKPDLNLLVWDKDLIFFPRKINGKFCFLHRIKPDIQIVFGVENLEDLTKDYWNQYFLHFDKYILMTPKYDHEMSYIGGGCPPIETHEGWLIIYHGVKDSVKGYIYSACAALLDLENPQKEIARLPFPLFSPEKQWELKGEVNNVCFPTGAILEDDLLYIYYGAADERIAVATVSLNELISELLTNKI